MPPRPHFANNIREMGAGIDLGLKPKAT